ncbi:hypothetical protein OKJ48_01960 [Streptomyces kunmingensis]|uniref:Uncharacterized protein n=1 Tax=Streptomyces kunmingensis TaxID=68225 RepID=A0ABU6C2T7_9ACTN|nr:hypothetical protein [Streptomyces kunmingensis]MEB3959028.1 hypothetical protein [Streptomyces kunmingensis]
MANWLLFSDVCPACALAQRDAASPGVDGHFRTVLPSVMKSP